MKNRYPKISTNILLLGIVSFLNDLSSEMIIPILPMFITALGGIGFTIGLIGGLRDSISSILKILSGYWSDRAGKRKIFVFSGYLTSFVFKLSLGFSKTWLYILVFADFRKSRQGLKNRAKGCHHCGFYARTERQRIRGS